jgi:hypothetical protein
VITDHPDALSRLDLVPAGSVFIREIQVNRNLRARLPGQDVERDVRRAPGGQLLQCALRGAVIGGDLAGKGDRQGGDADRPGVGDSAADDGPFVIGQLRVSQLDPDLWLGQRIMRRVHGDLGGEASLPVGRAQVVTVGKVGAGQPVLADLFRAYAQLRGHRLPREYAINLDLRRPA